MKNNQLTKKILFALIFGFFVGIVINSTKDSNIFPLLEKYLIDGVFTFLGTVFLRLLKFIMIPVVITSLIVGITNISSMLQVAKIGIKSLIFFMLTTVISISLAIGLSFLFGVGKGFKILNGTSDFVQRQAESFIDILVNMFPANILSPIVEVSMLQVVVLSIIVGIAILAIEDDNSKIIKFMKEAEKLSLSMVNLVMKLSPYGVFGLIAKVFAVQGLSVAESVLLYALVVMIALLIVLLVMQPLIVYFAGLSPWVFLKKCREVMLIAFSTSSSNATLPVTLATAEKKLGIDNSVAGFTIPLGATVNMNGTSIMIGVATVFIANIYSIDLSLLDIIGIICLATLAAIGTAGVPGVGILMLSLVLTQYNIPLEGIAIILTVDRILDMSRTAVNVMGDLAIATFIAKKDNKMDTDIFYTKE